MVSSKSSALWLIFSLFVSIHFTIFTSSLRRKLQDYTLSSVLFCFSFLLLHRKCYTALQFHRQSFDFGIDFLFFFCRNRIFRLNLKNVSESVCEVSTSYFIKSIHQSVLKGEITLFGLPMWTGDPSGQLIRLVDIIRFHFAAIRVASNSPGLFFFCFI